MKTLVAPAFAVLCLAAPAWAATALDTDGDGQVTLEEVQAQYPDITEETFTAMDANADGALDDSEIVAAQNAGVMPDAQG